MNGESAPAMIARDGSATPAAHPTLRYACSVYEAARKRRGISCSSAAAARRRTVVAAAPVAFACRRVDNQEITMAHANARPPLPAMLPPAYAVIRAFAVTATVFARHEYRRHAMPRHPQHAVRATGTRALARA